MKLVPPYNSAVVDFDCNNVVAPSNFAIIRAKEGFDSYYLSSVLNGKDVKRQLKRLVEGSSMAVIKINYLKELDIIKRDMEDQKNYGELYSLLTKRLRLQNKVLLVEERLTEDFLSDF